MYFVTKTYGHDVGLSACFRQHRAESHCRFLHGYALAVEITFCAEELDTRNWVVDFGGLDSLKLGLRRMFDHTTLVAEDDPKKAEILALGLSGLADVIEVSATGCEAFARMIYDFAGTWLQENGHAPRCCVYSVKVSEHGANSAMYQGR